MSHFSLPTLTKWAPAIGLGLYLGGHRKAGLIVGGLGVARWAIRRGYLHA